MESKDLYFHTHNLSTILTSLTILYLAGIKSSKALILKVYGITSTKFVQKLPELNKGNHNLETYRATQRHTGPYGTIPDHT